MNGWNPFHLSISDEGSRFVGNFKLTAMNTDENIASER